MAFVSAILVLAFATMTAVAQGAGRYGYQYCRMSEMQKCVSGPVHFKLGKPYCALKACYKYTKAAPCPRTPYSSTHKCEVSAAKRKAWFCKRRGGRGKYVMPSGETVEICQCKFKRVRTPKLSPVREYIPPCK